jgi:hypothetical protein
MERRYNVLFLCTGNSARSVTVARSLSDTFAGIRPVDVPPFLAAQVSGGILSGIRFRAA